MLINQGWPSVGDLEYDFLVLALASRLFPECPFPDPPADLDWERLDFLLRQHRLTTHFYVLGKSKRNNWPLPFRERLRVDRYGLIIYSEQFVKRIKPVLSSLREANIPVIVLKGWALIPIMYGGDYGQRYYSDIDILVQPNDVDKAELILKKFGWQAEEEQRNGFSHSYYNAQAYYLEPTEVQGQAFSIGFHWGLLHHPAYNPKQINVGEIFQRAHILEVAGIPVLEMSVEDHIIYNCAHIILQHRSEESLLRYYEIAAVIMNANSTLDWQKVEQGAKAWKVIIPLKKVTQKVHEIWPGTMSAAAIALIENGKPSMSELFIHNWYERTNYNPSLEHLLTWLTMAGIMRRICYIMEEVFPDKIYLQKYFGPAPGGIWPLLYFKRFAHAFRHFSNMPRNN